MTGSLVYGHVGLSDGAPSPDPPRVTYLTSAVSFSPHFSSFVKVPAPPDGQVGPSEHLPCTLTGGSAVGGKGLKTSFAMDPMDIWLKYPLRSEYIMHGFSMSLSFMYVAHHAAVVYLVLGGPGAGSATGPGAGAGVTPTFATHAPHFRFLEHLQAGLPLHRRFLFTPPSFFFWMPAHMFAGVLHPPPLPVHWHESSLRHAFFLLARHGSTTTCASATAPSASAAATASAPSRAARPPPRAIAARAPAPPLCAPRPPPETRREGLSPEAGGPPHKPLRCTGTLR